LGRETCRQLAERGLRVVATARDPNQARNVAASLTRGPPAPPVEALPVALDVADPASIAAAADHVGRAEMTLDVLVNNAGVSMNGFDAEVARATLAANFLGPLRVTEALLPMMRAGGVIVMVSSGMGELAGLAPALRARFTDRALTRQSLLALTDEFVADVAAGRHHERGWPTNAYRVSKIALNALVRIWAPELATRRIAINAVCPGWVRTDMGGRRASRSVEQGAASIVWAAVTPTGDAGPTGGFFRDGRLLDW
jgi:NAD(P)-dependent dehydrogenase (short-subunit alcohol dehydrogenase family)